MLDKTSSRPSKFRTKNWVQINYGSRGTYSVNRQINFKTSMLKSSLCDYSDAYILVKGNISVNNTAAAGADANNTNKKVIFKNCAPFTNCISKINNTQIDNAEYIDIVMPMYNLIEYSDNYSKTSGSLWQYCKDIPAVNNNGDIVDFNGANTAVSFNFKAKIIGQGDNNGRKDNVEKMVSLKYLRNFWRTCEMPLINCEINLIFTWSAGCVIIHTNIANQIPTFAITEANLYVPVVTLSTQDNAQLLTQYKSGFKKAINWNKYLSKPELLRRNPNLNHLVQQSFQGVKKVVIKPLAKCVLIPLWLTASASAADAGIHKKILLSGTTTLIILNDEMKDIEDSGLLLKGVSKTIQNEAEKQKGGFLSMLLGTLGTSLLGNILARKRINRTGEGVIIACYENKRQDHKNKMDS